METGRLEIRGVSGRALTDLLLEAELLEKSSESKWVEVLMLFTAQGVARRRNIDAAQNFAVNYFFDLVTTAGQVPPELRAAIVEHQHDADWLLGEAAQRWSGLCDEIESLCGFPITAHMTSSHFSSECLSPACTVKCRIAFRHPSEACELFTLGVEIQRSLDQETLVFGQLLGGFVFGTVFNGTSRAFREANFGPVRLHLSCESASEECDETAAEALQRVVQAAAAHAPRCAALGRR